MGQENENPNQPDLKNRYETLLNLERACTNLAKELRDEISDKQQNLKQVEDLEDGIHQIENKIRNQSFEVSLLLQQLSLQRAQQLPFFTAPQPSKDARQTQQNKTKTFTQQQKSATSSSETCLQPCMPPVPNELPWVASEAPVSNVFQSLAHDKNSTETFGLSLQFIAVVPNQKPGRFPQTWPPTAPVKPYSDDWTVLGVYKHQLAAALKVDAYLTSKNKTPVNEKFVTDATGMSYREHEPAKIYSMLGDATFYSELPGEPDRPQAPFSPLNPQHAQKRANQANKAHSGGVQKANGLTEDSVAHASHQAPGSNTKEAHIVWGNSNQTKVKLKKRDPQRKSGQQRPGTKPPFGHHSGKQQAALAQHFTPVTTGTDVQMGPASGSHGQVGPATGPVHPTDDNPPPAAQQAEPTQADVSLTVGADTGSTTQRAGHGGNERGLDKNGLHQPDSAAPAWRGDGVGGSAQPGVRGDDVVQGAGRQDTTAPCPMQVDDSEAYRGQQSAQGQQQAQGRAEAHAGAPEAAKIAKRVPLGSVKQQAAEQQASQGSARADMGEMGRGARASISQVLESVAAQFYAHRAGVDAVGVEGQVTGSGTNSAGCQPAARETAHAGAGGPAQHSTGVSKENSDPQGQQSFPNHQWQQPLPKSFTLGVSERSKGPSGSALRGGAARRSKAFELARKRAKQQHQNAKQTKVSTGAGEAKNGALNNGEQFGNNTGATLARHGAVGVDNVMPAQHHPQASTDPSPAQGQPGSSSQDANTHTPSRPSDKTKGGGKSSTAVPIPIVDLEQGRAGSASQGVKLHQPVQGQASGLGGTQKAGGGSGGGVRPSMFVDLTGEGGDVVFKAGSTSKKSGLVQGLNEGKGRGVGGVGVQKVSKVGSISDPGGKEGPAVDGGGGGAGGGQGQRSVKKFRSAGKEDQTPSVAGRNPKIEEDQPPLGGAGGLSQQLPSYTQPLPRGAPDGTQPVGVSAPTQPAQQAFAATTPLQQGNTSHRARHVQPETPPTPRTPKAWSPPVSTTGPRQTVPGSAAKIPLIDLSTPPRHPESVSPAPQVQHAPHRAQHATPSPSHHAHVSPVSEPPKSSTHNALGSRQSPRPATDREASAEAVRNWWQSRSPTTGADGRNRVRGKSVPKTDPARTSRVRARMQHARASVGEGSRSNMEGVQAMGGAGGGVHIDKINPNSTGQGHRGSVAGDTTTHPAVNGHNSAINSTRVAAQPGQQHRATPGHAAFVTQLAQQVEHVLRSSGYTRDEPYRASQTLGMPSTQTPGRADHTTRTKPVHVADQHCATTLGQGHSGQPNDVWKNNQHAGLDTNTSMPRHGAQSPNHERHAHGFATSAPHPSGTGAGQAAMFQTPLTTVNGPSLGRAQQDSGQGKVNGVQASTGPPGYQYSTDNARAQEQERARAQARAQAQPQVIGGDTPTENTGPRASSVHDQFATRSKAQTAPGLDAHVAGGRTRAQGWATSSSNGTSPDPSRDGAARVHVAGQIYKDGVDEEGDEVTGKLRKGVGHNIAGRGRGAAGVSGEEASIDQSGIPAAKAGKVGSSRMDISEGQGRTAGRSKLGSEGVNDVSMAMGSATQASDKNGVGTCTMGGSIGEQRAGGKACGVQYRGVVQEESVAQQGSEMKSMCVGDDSVMQSVQQGVEGQHVHRSCSPRGAESVSMGHMARGPGDAADVPESVVEAQANEAMGDGIGDVDASLAQGVEEGGEHWSVPNRETLVDRKAQEEEWEQRRAVIQQQSRDIQRARIVARKEREAREIEARAAARAAEFRQQEAQRARDEAAQRVLRDAAATKVSSMYGKCKHKKQLLRKLGFVVPDGAAADALGKIMRRALSKYHPDKLRGQNLLLKDQLEKEEIFKLLSSLQ